MIKVFSGETTTCNLAEYQIGNECCPMCLRGSRVRTDCTEFRSTSCLPCLEGTYMNQPSGLKQCFPCSQCDAGSGLKIKCSCTTTSDTVCEPLEGFYCVDPSDNGCRAAQKHRSCEPGQYISQKGWFSYVDLRFSKCRTEASHISLLHSQMYVCVCLCVFAHVVGFDSHVSFYALACMCVSVCYEPQPGNNTCILNAHGQTK
uniref:TNFR-Cys domain-containing protein n=1 Tax=Anabas testudineus TaxID=64144 RepID=A0A7N5ZW55_ANATE